eukprot:g5931.t1
MFSKLIQRSLIYHRQVDSVTFTTTAWFEYFKSTALSLIPSSTALLSPQTEVQTKQKFNDSSETPSPSSVGSQNTTPVHSAVSLILDRFPTGNKVTSLELLAEIGSHFTEARALTQFHQTTNSGTGLDLYQQLGDLQLHLVKQLPPLVALDVYKGLAALRLTPSEDIHEVIFNALVNHIDNLTVSQISSFIQAKFLMKPEVESEMMHDMSEIFIQTLKGSKKRQMKDATHVVRVLEVCTKHKMEDYMLLDEIVNFLKGRVQGLSPSDLVDTVYYLTRLDARDEKLFDAIVVEVLQKGADQFSPSEISTLAASLTKSGHFDVMTDVLLDSLAISCKNRIQKMSYEELVDLLWAYSHHLHFHHDDKLLSSLTNGLVQKLTGAKTMDRVICVKLAKIITAADLGNEVCSVILQSVSQHALEVFGTLQKQELLSVLQSCKKAKFYCDGLLGGLIDNLLIKQQDLTSSDCSSILNNCAALDFHPGNELLEIALHLTTTQYHKMNSTQVCNTIWSLVYFHKLTRDNGRELFDHLGTFSRSKFNALDIQKLILSEKLLLCNSMSPSQETEDPEEQLIPDPLRSELFEMWKERIYFTRSISPFQQEISRLLTKLNISHEAEALIDNGDLSVDFLLFMGRADSQQRVILECDGPRRRAINFPYRPLGETLTFKRLLKAQGWTALVISKQEWQEKSSTEREQYLKSILSIHTSSI